MSPGGLRVSPRVSREGLILVHRRTLDVSVGAGVGAPHQRGSSEDDVPHTMAYVSERARLQFLGNLVRWAPSEQVRMDHILQPYSRWYRQSVGQSVKWNTHHPNATPPARLRLHLEEANFLVATARGIHIHDDNQRISVANCMLRSFMRFEALWVALWRWAGE